MNKRPDKGERTYRSKRSDRSKRLDISKAFLSIVILNLAEVAVTAGILLYLSSGKNGAKLLFNPGMIVLLITIFAVVILNSVAAFRNRANVLRADSQFRFLEETLSKLEDLNKTLRAQRHDFMNHLQVVYSLMEMDEYKDSKDYIEKVYNDIQRVNRVMKTSNPAVNALLQAKIINCEKKGITADLNVTTRFKELITPSWEFCRVLGNIIDNSIYALENKGHDMNLKIDLYEDLKCYYFKVSDNGSTIPQELINKIFEPGFTTKGEKGEGMGLAISKEIIEQHGGKINASNIDGLTVFEGIIPRA